MDANYQQGPYTDAFALGTYTSNFAEGYLTASQTLYSFGHTANQVRAADARSRAEGHALRLTESQVFAQAVTAYMDVLRDRNVLDVRKADLDMLVQQVRLTTSRYDLGGQPSEQVTRTNVAQAETRRRSAEVALTQARAQLAASVASFRAVMGVAPKELTMPDGLPLPRAGVMVNRSPAPSRSSSRSTTGTSTIPRSVRHCVPQHTPAVALRSKG